MPAYNAHVITIYTKTKMLQSDFIYKKYRSLLNSSPIFTYNNVIHVYKYNVGYININDFNNQARKMLNERNLHLDIY